MKFVSPEFVTKSDVTERIANASSDEEIINIALSAVYHCDTEFSGNTLLEAFQLISGPNRLFLGNITCTFLRMHNTAYMVDDFIEEMKKVGPDPKIMTENIEEAIWCKKRNN